MKVTEKPIGEPVLGLENTLLATRLVENNHGNPLRKSSSFALAALGKDLLRQLRRPPVCSENTKAPLGVSPGVSRAFLGRFSGAPWAILGRSVGSTHTRPSTPKDRPVAKTVSPAHRHSPRVEVRHG